MSRIKPHKNFPVGSLIFTVGDKIAIKFPPKFLQVPVAKEGKLKRVSIMGYVRKILSNYNNFMYMNKKVNTLISVMCLTKQIEGNCKRNKIIRM
jgi:hypothetical protein